jgi:diguanylate cyclase (GGDEF)-like protein
MPDDSASHGPGNGRDGAPTSDRSSANANPIDLLLAQKKRLEQLNGWFDIALNNMVRGLSMFDSDQRLIVCNQSYRQMYALPEELTRPGTPLSEIVRYHVRQETGRDGGEEAAKQAKWLSRHVARLARGHPFSHIQTMRDGRKFLVTYQPLADGGWVDIQEDITEKRRAEEKIEWLALHDPLTGTANRFHFRQTFEKALGSLCDGASLALHWLDLDRFKDVNDTLGHPVGDALLKVVAQRLRRSVRTADFLARLGGDEFAIIQSAVACPGQCEDLAKRILHDFSRPYHVLGHSISISASIGIVTAPEDGDSADELLKKADVALYEVKDRGRRGYVFYRNGGASDFDANRLLEIEIHAALDQNQFELHYQPVLNLRSQHVTSCEALLRWRHPRDGLLPPAHFLAAAERTGLIVDIGRWVLGQACHEAKRWSDAMKVTVNVSALQLEAGNLLSIVRRALSGAELTSARLNLEIGEALLDRNGQARLKMLTELRALGIGITLDDFGRTSGSLANLQIYPFDEVKIDRELVKDVPSRACSAAIVKAVVEISQSLGIRSVAEGVETHHELSTVAEVGCNKVQGYYISRPVPASELGDVLTQCSQKMWLAA